MTWSLFMTLMEYGVLAMIALVIIICLFLIVDEVWSWFI